MSKLYLRASLLLAFALFSYNSIIAQTPEHGREQAMGTFNFSVMAAWYASHPETPVRHQEENDEEEDMHPPFPRTSVDTSLNRYRRTFSAYSSSSYATALLPPSPSPTDTFQAIYDNNTSIPPDTHGDVDSNYCVTTINPNVRIQTRAGAIVSTVTLDQFFRPVCPGGGVFDPRTHYDPYTKRWYVIADANAQTDSNILLIAISQTSNPTGSWYEFRVIMDAGGTSWLDYPTIGYNKKWITIAGNRFYNSGGYRDAKVVIFNKAQLLAGAGAPYTSFVYASSFTISPAITYDTSLSNMFAVESWDGYNGQLKLWKISGAVGSETMTAVATPTSSARWQFSSNMFTGTSGSDFAPQSGTANKIQTNDDRIYDCRYVNNAIWCSHTVFLPYSTSVNASRTSAQWWQVDTAGTPIQIGRIDDPSTGNFYYFPSIAVNKYNDALVGFSTSSSATHINVGYALHMHTDPADSMRPVNIYRHGQTTYYKTFSGTRNRFGDYSNSTVDPVNMTDFWTLQEVASGTANRWDTWWAHVKVCTQPPALVTPAGPTTFCTGGNVVLNATTGAGYTYQWRLGGVDIAGATLASYTATTAGTFAVRITDLSCDSTSPGVTVTVLSSTTAAIGSTATAVCVGQTITYTDATAGGIWSSSNTGIATISTTGVIYGIAAGTATISYSVTNACGTSVQTLGVTVNALPVVSAITGTTSLCVGGTSTLSSTTTGGVWSSSATSVATVTTTGVVTGAGNGTAVITYSVTNSAGCTAYVTTTVNVNTAFTPTITAGGATSFCTGGSVTLSATPTGGGYSYQWQIGGVNIAGATNSSYSATASGVYTALVTFGTCAISSTGITVTVSSVFAAPIVGATTVCNGSTTTLTDATAGGTWSTSNAAVASINTGGVVFGVSLGSATISYAVTNSCGTAVVTAGITVAAPPTIAAITGTTTACTGSSTTLANTTAGGIWSSSNSAIATVSGSGVVTGVAAGTATISYSVTGGAGGCTASALATVTIVNGPAAGISASGATTFCIGANVVLSTAIVSGYTYQWQNGGVNIAGATTASYTATAGGTYTVLVSSGSCTTTSAGVAVTVTTGSIIVPFVSITAAPGFVLCTGMTSASFTATPVNGGTAPVYQWFINGIPAGTGSTMSYAPTAGDVVKVRLRSNATCAYPDTAIATGTMSYSAMVYPSVGINAVPNDTVCEGDAVSLIAVPVNGGTAPTYAWTKNGISVATGAMYSYIPLNGDIIKVQLRSNFLCRLSDTANSAPITLHVDTNTVNTVHITASQTSIRPGQPVTFTAVAPHAGAAATYQWFINGVAVAGATNNVYTTSTLANGQVVTCQVTSTELCAHPGTATSGGVSVVVTTATGELTLQQTGFTLYPNPTSGTFTIKGQLDSDDDNIGIKVTNMLGETMYTAQTASNNTILAYDVVLDQHLARGIYVVQIATRTGTTVLHISLQ